MLESKLILKIQCIPSKDGRGPCQHCLRRYPPVECTGRPDPYDPRKGRRASNMQNMARTASETETLLVTAPKEQSPQDIGLTVAISQRAFGGALAALNASNGFTIEPTVRNAELFHFCKLHISDPLKTRRALLTPYSSAPCGSGLYVR
jgi:hypothetical protein